MATLPRLGEIPGWLADVLYLGTDLDAGFVVSAVDPGPAVDATDLRR